MNYEITPRAETDLREAYQFYEQQEKGVGEEFLTDFLHVVQKIV
jgi:hypothetical protein